MTITLPISTLKTVFCKVQPEIRSKSPMSAFLPLVCCLAHRLSIHHEIDGKPGHLLSTTGGGEGVVGGGGPLVDSSMDKDLSHKELMYSEQARLASFAKWPHMDYK